MPARNRTKGLLGTILVSLCILQSVLLMSAKAMSFGNVDESSLNISAKLILSDALDYKPAYLAYSTFLGGSDSDQIYDMARGLDDSIYLVGTTSSQEAWASLSTNYIGPTGQTDIFVIKLDPTGTKILYATVIGGSGKDRGYSIDVDWFDTVYITGNTGSTDFPATPAAYDTTCDTWACSDVFVARLNEVGTELLFATYLGGRGFDAGNDILVDSRGYIYVSGTNQYGDFPTTANAYDTTYNGGQSVHNMGDGFIAKLNSNASALVYSTYLGGRQADEISAMIIDRYGQVIVTGYTRSFDFPTTYGAYDRRCGTDGNCDETSSSLGYGGPSDVFVTKFTSTGSNLIYSTFIGSRESESGKDLILHSNGFLYVVGETGSSSFPTTSGALDPHYNGGGKDAFLFSLDNNGTSLVYSTFLGGQNDDTATVIQEAKDGSIYIAGVTRSTNFPVTNDGYDQGHNGGDDGFVSVVYPFGTSLDYGTFIGGKENDQVLSLIIDESLGMYLSGSTFSPDYPTSADAYDNTCGTDGACNDSSYARSDAFLSKFNDGFSITGQVTNFEGIPMPNVTVWVGFPTNTQTDSNGRYEFNGLQPGTYILTGDGDTFFPPSRAVHLPPDAVDQDFIAVAMSDCDLTSDRDGDALLDGWELCGYDHNNDGDPDVDLPAMGAHPLHKDVFVEIDFMEAGPGETESHKPKDGAIKMIVDSFNNAPVINHDGTTGIHLHVDYGADAPLSWGQKESWGDLSGSDALLHQTYLISCPVLPSWSKFDAMKLAMFKEQRSPIFHYNIWAHQICPLFGDRSGISRNNLIDVNNGASDFIVSLGSHTQNPGTTHQQAGTFMHELGHNLGLGHGGGDNTNLKPNYLSIMNYSFQFRGLIVDKDNGHFDYSRFELPDLNELSLNETVGIQLPTPLPVVYGTKWFCGENQQYNFDASRVDWNCDGDTFDTHAFGDINDDIQINLKGHNDWITLVFDGGAVGDLGAGEELPVETDLIDELTEEQDNQFAKVEKAFLPIFMK